MSKAGERAQHMRNLPSVPGVYIVLREGDVQYVGQSCNIQQRMTTSYSYNWKTDDLAIVHKSDVVARRVIERKLIYALQPKGNTRFKDTP